MFKEDIHKVQKEWETYDWQGGVSLICKNQCIKEHTVIARTVEILETWNCSTEDTLILKGRKATVYHVVHIYMQDSTYCTHA